MKFEEALQLLREGKKLGRSSWSLGDCIEADPHLCSVVFTYDVRLDAKTCRQYADWKPDYQDMFATDWELA